MRLSVIATIPSQSPFLEEFYTRVSTAAWILVGDDYELILLYSGERSNSAGAANSIVPEDSHLRMLVVPAHASKPEGIMTALAQATGEKIFLIDARPDEDPEWLLAFSAALEENDSDLIYAVEEKQRPGWLQTVLSFFPLIFGKWLPKKTSLSAALMTRRLAQAIVSSQKPALISAMPVALEGFKQQPFAVIVNLPADSDV